MYSVEDLLIIMVAFAVFIFCLWLEEREKDITPRCTCGATTGSCYSSMVERKVKSKNGSTIIMSRRYSTKCGKVQSVIKDARKINGVGEDDKSDRV